MRTILFFCFLLAGCASVHRSLVNNQWDYVSRQDLKEQGLIVFGGEAYPDSWSLLAVFRNAESGEKQNISAGAGNPGIRLVPPGVYHLEKMVMIDSVHNKRIEIPMRSNSIDVKKEQVVYSGDFIFTFKEAGNADLNSPLSWVGAAMGIFATPVQVRWRAVDRAEERKKELSSHWGTGDFDFIKGLLNPENVLPF